MKIKKQGFISRLISGISLHKKLIIVFVAIAIIPLLFANIITTRIVEESVAQSVFEKNQNLADNMARELNADFDGKIRVLKIAVNNPDIRSMDPGRQTQVLQDILSQYPDMGMAAISDANGTQTGRSDGMPDSTITYTDREYFQRMQKTGNTTVSDVLKAKSSDRIVFVIAEPIKNDDQTIRGALLVNVEINKTVAHIAETKIGRTGYAFVVNNDGKVIIHPDPGVVANATDMSFLAPVKSALIGNTGWAQYELDGQTRLAGYSYVPITGWGLIVAQPLDEAMTEVVAIRDTNVLIMVCTIFLAFFFILALAGAIFRPIALLTAAAENAGHGDLTVQASVVSHDEIGTLASTFNIMIARIRRRDEALKESHRRLEDIINFLPDPTFVIDLEGKIIAWNKATEEMTGINAQDILGKNNYEHGFAFYGEKRPILIDLLLKDDKETGKKYQKFQKIGDRYIGARYSQAVYSGKGADLVGTASPLYDTKGNITGAIESVRDVTDRKRAEEALTLARNKLDLLNSVTFTEIQNAVFSLSGYLELGINTPDSEKNPNFEDRQIEIVQTIANSLKFAQNYQHLGLKPPTWQNVQQSFLYGISHLDISKLSRQLNVVGLEIYADPLLENVFFTLAENVVLHGKTATEIVFRYHESQKGLTLFFEDNGVGIQNDKKEKIFNRQYEEKKGMGLFLTREILSITGMIIKETGEPGKGARFEIFVPKGMYRFTDSR